MDDSAPARPGDQPLPGGPTPGDVRTFHARRGRLSDQSRARVAQLLEQYGVPAGQLDLAALFGGRPVVVEIGFGMGEATLEMALADPGTAILAVDVHTPGALRLLSAVEVLGVANLRVAHEDALPVLRRVAPDSLAGVRAFFPDPWPKLRHRKRRLVQPAAVALMASRLRGGGVLHLTTDVPDYAEQMLAVTSAEPLLHNDFDGYAPRPLWRPSTRYEQRGHEHGHPVVDLMLRRVG
jgi:tRNA (guanine-N7-)-methyltransferase